MTDLRLALRSLRATPVVSIVAALSLALGIGANTAIFSLVNSLLLRTLPVKAPAQLALITDDQGRGITSWTYPIWEQITFPAAILQPPYFDPNADPASNYGSIGATIGHEIGHGFDDQGRQFDGQGRLRDWWTAASAKAYTGRAQALVKQYDSYEPIPGVNIKGQLTLGENLGDLGGLEVAYAAYRKYVAAHGEPQVIDGLTGDQRFFIAYGYSWEIMQREGSLRSQRLTDPH